MASGSDTMSMVSGLDGISMDSEPNTEFNFGDMQSKVTGRKKTQDIENVDIGGNDMQKKNFNSYRKKIQASLAK